ncbi:MAG: zinc-dependent alcohol dehydrogenase family protein [Planctomycetes bacterium]|nr:zinc-dependent alcohol dehydrogenase family protein [Planctomycetota bacterium]
MQSVQFDQFGEPAEVLQTRDIETPHPKSGEVLVRMLFSPVNPSDLMTVRGVYGKLPNLPCTPGYEGVGVVEASGGGLLGKFLVGKRVALLNGINGNWQEKTTALAKQAVPLPKSLPSEQGAAFFVNPVTAYAMTRRVLAVPVGDWLLQTAAASELGKMIVRLGQRFGFKTFNVVRRSEQVEVLKSLGADAVVVFDPATQPADDLRNELHRVTGGRGVQFGIDPVGGLTGSAVVKCLAQGGRMLVYGTLSPEPLSFSPRDLMTPGASISGFWLARWLPQLSLIAKLKLIRTVSGLIQEGVLTSQIGEVFPLDRVNEAVAAAETPGRAGKVLLRIAAQ